MRTSIFHTMSREVRITMLSALLFTLPAAAVAQDVSQIAKSDPLIITGAVGTNNTYHYSSTGYTYGSPLGNTFYANMNISIYGISMPFSIYYSNDNLDFSYPQFSFNLSPKYKKWQGHIGQSSMQYSEYVMSMSFNGVGIEYDDENKIRFGAFYGVLRNAVNDNPEDPTARAPQYKRVGWGFKAGYGTSKAFLDLYVLRAYDRPKSLDEGWRRLVLPQENVAIALKGGLNIIKNLSLNANVATSLFTGDMEAEKITDGDATRYSSIIEPRYSSLVRFAGDVSLSYTMSGFSTSLFYRLVQPDYNSLGCYYMSNNYHSLGINASTTLFKKLTLAGTFSGQSDNLTNKQLYTTHAYVYSLTASTRLGEKINLAASYNGYLQSQSDGTVRVNDSTEVHRAMHSFSFIPTYMTQSETLGHSVSLSLSFTQNKDLNKFSKGETDVKATAIGASYGLDIKPWELNIGSSVSHQISKGYQTEYTSDVFSLNANRSFLEEKNLNLGATFNLIYNEVKRRSKSMSIGFDLSAGYTLKKVHSFSLAAGINTYGDVNQNNRRARVNNRDITASLNYAYTFSLLEMKRKGEKKK